VVDTSKSRGARAHHSAISGAVQNSPPLTHEFSLVVRGIDILCQTELDRLFESGCDDATVSMQRGLVILDFAREAPSFARALSSAIADAQAAGAQVIRVEPDHLVTVSEMAGRANLTRAATSLYARGERGEGFPQPVGRITTESPLWDWAAVARWLNRRGSISTDAVRKARVIRQANHRLDGSRNAER
jgi:hypothetical protein